jgi:hypothetical protein
VTRFLTALNTPHQRAVARRAIDKAPEGYVCEVREAKRSDPQNSAMWSLLGQIAKQRPTHNGARMTPELWKAVFMQALGSEMVMMPTLDGDGFFPLGHRSSALTKGEMADLITLILAWTAREGLTIRHFDEFIPAAQEPGGVNSPSRVAA